MSAKENYEPDDKERLGRIERSGERQMSGPSNEHIHGMNQKYHERRIAALERARSETTTLPDVDIPETARNALDTYWAKREPAPRRTFSAYLKDLKRSIKEYFIR